MWKRQCTNGNRCLTSWLLAGCSETLRKTRFWKMATVCILFFLCCQKTYQSWTSTRRNITYEIIFSQLLDLHFALMFVLPMRQLVLPSVPCCYNKPFPIHVISKGKKTAWKQNKENRTKENQGFFQRPIWCTSINRKKMPEEVGARNCTSRQLLTCVVSSTLGFWMVNK